jgi:hypothetical protein
MVWVEIPPRSERFTETEGGLSDSEVTLTVRVVGVLPSAGTFSGLAIGSEMLKVPEKDSKLAVTDLLLLKVTVLGFSEPLMSPPQPVNL